MKKTGKALSLVLSLALVVSSLTATFASAATAKMEYLPATAVADSIDLVSGKSGSASNTDLSTTIQPVISDQLTSDHLKVASMTLAEVVYKSGAALLSTKVDQTSHKLTATLNSDSAVGTEVLAARYVSDPSLTYRYTDSTQPILFTEEVDYTVIVHKNGSLAFQLDPISKNDSKKQIKGSIIQYSYGTNGMIAAKTEVKVDAPKANVTKGAATPTAVGTYYVTAPSFAGNSACTVTTASPTSFVATLTTPANANYLSVGTVVFYAAKVTVAAKSDADAVLDTANTVVGTTTINNTVELGSMNCVSQWRGATWADTTAAQVNWNSETSSDTVPSSTAINITGCDITLGSNTEMIKGNVGKVSGGFDFTIDNGTVSKIDSSVKNVKIFNGNVGAVAADTSVMVQGGTMGAISAPIVTIDATDSNGKITTHTAAITGETITIGSAATSASIVTGAIKEKGAAGSVLVGPSADNAESITLMSKYVSVPSIDCDYYAPLIDLKGFTGTIAAPLNAANATISSDVLGSTDTTATVTGNVIVSSVNANDGTLTFANSLNVNTVTGIGTVVVPAGAMKVNKSITSVSLMLSNDKISTGMTAFYAPAYSVYDGSLKTVGYTLDYDAVNNGTKTGLQPFNIKNVVFAGLVITPTNGASNKILQKTKATYQVSAYPGGTSIPDGDAIAISFSGSSSNFSYTTTANSITVSADKYESLFASLNNGTITATLVDKATNTPIFGISPANYNVQMIEKPETKYTSDTNSTLNLKVGQQYTYKITSTDGSDPKFGFGTGGIAKIVNTKKSGNATFYTVEGVKDGGTGVFVADGAKINVINVKGFAYKSDTPKVTVKAGKSYTFKITADSKYTAKVVFQVCGFSAKNTVAGKVTTNKDHTVSYLFKITNNGTANGTYGAYVNGVRVGLVTAAK